MSTNNKIQQSDPRDQQIILNEIDQNFAKQEPAKKDFRKKKQKVLNIEPKPNLVHKYSSKHLLVDPAINSLLSKDYRHNTVSRTKQKKRSPSKSCANLVKNINKSEMDNINQIIQESDIQRSMNNNNRIKEFLIENKIHNLPPSKMKLSNQNSYVNNNKNVFNSYVRLDRFRNINQSLQNLNNQKQSKNNSNVERKNSNSVQKNKIESNPYSSNKKNSINHSNNKKNSLKKMSSNKESPENINLNRQKFSDMNSDKKQKSPLNKNDSKISNLHFNYKKKSKSTSNLVSSFFNKSDIKENVENSQKKISIQQMNQSKSSELNLTSHDVSIAVERSKINQNDKQQITIIDEPYAIDNRRNNSTIHSFKPDKIVVDQHIPLVKNPNKTKSLKSLFEKMPHHSAKKDSYSTINDKKMSMQSQSSLNKQFDDSKHNSIHTEYIDSRKKSSLNNNNDAMQLQSRLGQLQKKYSFSRSRHKDKVNVISEFISPPKNSPKGNRVTSPYSQDSPVVSPGASQNAPQIDLQNYNFLDTILDTDEDRSEVASNLKTVFKASASTFDPASGQLSKIQKVMGDDIVLDDTLKQQLFNKRSKFERPPFQSTDHPNTKSDHYKSTAATNSVFKINSAFDKIGPKVIKNDDALTQEMDKMKYSHPKVMGKDMFSQQTSVKKPDPALVKSKVEHQFKTKNDQNSRSGSTEMRESYNQVYSKTRTSDTYQPITSNPMSTSYKLQENYLQDNKYQSVTDLDFKNKQQENIILPDDFYNDKVDLSPRNNLDKSFEKKMTQNELDKTDKERFELEVEAIHSFSKKKSYNQNKQLQNSTYDDHESAIKNNTKDSRNFMQYTIQSGTIKDNTLSLSTKDKLGDLMISGNQELSTTEIKQRKYALLNSTNEFDDSNYKPISDMNNNNDVYQQTNSIDKIIGNDQEIRLHEERIKKMIHQDPFHFISSNFFNFKKIMKTCYGNFDSQEEAKSVLKNKFKIIVPLDKFLDRQQKDIHIFWSTLNCRIYHSRFDKILKDQGLCFSNLTLMELNERWKTNNYFLKDTKETSNNVIPVNLDEEQELDKDHEEMYFELSTQYKIHQGSKTNVQDLISCATLDLITIQYLNVNESMLQQEDQITDTTNQPIQFNQNDDQIDFSTYNQNMYNIEKDISLNKTRSIKKRLNNSIVSSLANTGIKILINKNRE